jgi:hypothetical protein
MLSACLPTCCCVADSTRKGDGRRHAEQPIARLYGIPAARGDLDRRAAGKARPADRRGSSGIGAERPSRRDSRASPHTAAVRSAHGRRAGIRTARAFREACPRGRGRRTSKRGQPLRGGRQRPRKPSQTKGHHGPAGPDAGHGGPTPRSGNQQSFDLDGARFAA